MEHSPLTPAAIKITHRTGICAFISLAFFSALVVAQPASAQSIYENYTFITLAGPGSAGPGSVDGQTNNARFNQPDGIARDPGGNLYIADSGNHTIRKVTPQGLVTTIAGLAGFPGTNDGAGAAARFNAPFGVALDANTNLYVSDTDNNTIRKITPAGIVTTFAGAPGVSSNLNGSLSVARFNSPRGIAFDSSNNLYVADSGNNSIRKITPSGIVSVLAGSNNPQSTGTNNGTGASALFYFPIGVATGPDGNIYVADDANDTIREITPKGVVTTLAGLGGSSGSADGTNGTARFFSPFDLTVDGSTNVYVTDTQNDSIRLVTPGGVVTTLAGKAGTAGSVDATGQAARFHFPIGITLDQNTNLFVTDFGNDTVREVSPALVVSTIAGSPGGSGTNDGVGSSAQFNFPVGLALDSSGNLYVADYNNQTIRQITPAAAVTTLAGLAGAAGTNDGVGSSARFDNPAAVAVDQNGNVLVGDTLNDAIRQVTPLGNVTTLAGLSDQAGSSNGPIATATFNEPFGLTVDTNNNIFVADTGNDAIREITTDDIVSTFAGAMRVNGTNDGVGTNAQFSSPEGIALDANENLYVVDHGNSTVRLIMPDATVSTFAGIPGVNGSADGPAATSTFNSPFGAAVDKSGNVYVSDLNNATVRKITPTGMVTTIGGVAGQPGNLDGTGSDARFNEPTGLAVDDQGNIYVADGDNNSIRKGYPSLPDMPTVNLIGAPVGVTRNFGIANQTTTLWSWSIIRQPANSSAQLINANTANPTFTPDVEDIYVIQFQGWDSSGHTTIRRITIYADNTPPTIAITNPAAGEIASNGLFTVAGTTTDNLGVSNVFVQLNGGAWASATGTTNWAVTQNLVKGTNVILAYSEDFAGNVSATNEVNLFYILSDRLKVVAKGGGILKPNLNGVFLQIGQTYSISAKAVPGSTFSNWSANIGPGTNSATITFVMQSNLSLTANFIDHERPTVLITSPKPAKFFSSATLAVAGIAKDNDSVAGVSYQLNGGPWTNATGTTNWSANVSLNAGANTFLVCAQDPSGNRSTTNHVTLNYLPTAIAGGNYAGLFLDTNNVTATNAGFFSAAVTPTAAFTAKMLLGGSTISFGGQFSQDGLFSNSIAAKSFNTPFTVQLQLDLTGAGTITGSVANSGWSSPLLANQDVFSKTNPPSQLFERFGLVIPGTTNSSTTQPGGNSFGSIIIDGAGNVTYSGTLADGSPASQQTFISKDGQWPFYISSCSGQGVTLGWLTFSQGQKGTLGGQVYWQRLPLATAKLYPGGFNFTNGIETVGSFYNFFIGIRTLVLPNYSGIAVLQQADLSPDLTNSFTLDTHDVAMGTNNFKTTISFYTGVFKGTIVNPANNTSIPFSGVVLNDQNAGFGFFVNSNQSGSVYIGQ